MLEALLIPVSTVYLGSVCVCVKERHTETERQRKLREAVASVFMGKSPVGFCACLCASNGCLSIIYVPLCVAVAVSL